MSWWRMGNEVGEDGGGGKQGGDVNFFVAEGLSVILAPFCPLWGKTWKGAAGTPWLAGPAKTMLALKSGKTHNR